MNEQSIPGTTSSIRAILLRLAKRQEDLAADAAAQVPYWSPCPPTVLGHRAAAAALRSQAEELLAPAGTAVR